MRVDEVKPGDEELVRLAQGGDSAAFSELVVRHQNEVYTLALRLVGDREMAADVAQEAFVRGWRALPKFRGDSRFTTWMHRITVNTAWSLRAKAARRRTERIDDLAFEPRSTGMSPERAGELSELRPRIESALSVLPIGTRTVVVLKDVYGWSHPEIAEHLDISVAASKVRLHRGRKRLRDELWPYVEETS
jgi:RNA polymerase sigma-70 factor (ECF subfamily)